MAVYELRICICLPVLALLTFPSKFPRKVVSYNPITHSTRFPAYCHQLLICVLMLATIIYILKRNSCCKSNYIYVQKTGNNKYSWQTSTNLLRTKHVQLQILDEKFHEVMHEVTRHPPPGRKTSNSVQFYFTSFFNSYSREDF